MLCSKAAPGSMRSIPNSAVPFNVPVTCLYYVVIPACVECSISHPWQAHGWLSHMPCSANQGQHLLQSVSDLSSALRSARSQAGEDNELSVFMSSLQGAQLSDADFAEDGQTLNLLSLDSDGRDADSELPLVYDPEAISDYWSVRPTSVVSRVLQLTSISSQFLTGIAWDIATGKLKENEVKRAIQIRRIVTSLGARSPHFSPALHLSSSATSPAPRVQHHRTLPARP